MKTNVNSLVSIEDKIFSDIWGIKGQIDAIVLSEFIHNRKMMTQPHIFELKAGHYIRNEHYAQVVLYELIVRDKYSHLMKNDLENSEKTFSGSIIHAEAQFDQRGVTHTQSY